MTNWFNNFDKQDVYIDFLLTSQMYFHVFFLHYSFLVYIPNSNAVLHQTPNRIYSIIIYPAVHVIEYSQNTRLSFSSFFRYVPYEGRYASRHGCTKRSSSSSRVSLSRSPRFRWDYMGSCETSFSQTQEMFKAIIAINTFDRKHQKKEEFSCWASNPNTMPTLALRCPHGTN